MNKLEPNMYVRTKSGLIAKYTGFEKDENDDECNKYNFDGKIFWYYEYYNEYVYEEDFEYWFENSVVKTSHNIIDLIEVGDYVNGYLIDYINLTCKTPFLRSERPYRVDNTLYSTLKEKGRDYNQPLHFYNEDIKSIVTKEQISSMEYRLGE